MVIIQMIRNYRVLGFKWDIYILFPPSKGPGITMEERAERVEYPEGVDVLSKTVFSGHDRAVVHMHSQWLWLLA